MAGSECPRRGVQTHETHAQLGFCALGHPKGRWQEFLRYSPHKP